MGNDKRRIEISTKLYDMGEALIKEGLDSEDGNIARCGNFLIFNSGVLFNDEDSNFLDEICTMFSYRKLLESSDVYDKISTLSSSEIMLLVKNLKNK